MYFSYRPTTSDQETTEMDEEADHGTDGIGQPSSDNEAQLPFPRSIMTIVLPVIESLKQLVSYLSLIFSFQKIIQFRRIRRGIFNIYIDFNLMF